jgi:hypothetical protein
MLDEMTDNEMLDVLYEEVKRVKQADLYKRWKKTGRL